MAFCVVNVGFLGKGVSPPVPLPSGYAYAAYVGLHVCLYWADTSLWS